MSWNPSIKTEGGMYAGYKMPEVDLSKFASLGAVSGDKISTSTILYEPYNPDDWEWLTARGLNPSKLKNTLNEARTIVSDPEWHRNVLLFEIPFENPGGAQYYKQTLQVYCDYLATEDMTTVYDADEPHTYTEEMNTFAVVSLKRAEYATPYSTPTYETIATGGFSVNFNRLGGEKEYGPAYYREYGFMTLGASKFSYNDTPYLGVYMYIDYERNTDGERSAFYGLLAVEKDTLFEYFAAEPEETDDPNEPPEPDPEDDPSGGGGDGEQDKHQDAVPIPDNPLLSGVSAGFVTMYKLYEASMQTFAHDLFDPDLWSMVKQLFADPMDFICGILILPFSPHTARSARPILQRTPLIAWTYYYPVVEDQYAWVDCGTIEIPMYYKNCFDYNPYTKDSLYLPYCGNIDLNPDEVQGHTLRIKYRIDCATGDCVAFVARIATSGLTPVEQVIAQISGNCGVRVPFGRQSFDNAITAGIQLMSGAAGMIGGVAMLAGGAGGLASGGKQLAEGLIASGVAGMTTSAVNGSKAHTERSGVMGASVGYMGVQYPYLIRQIPHQSLPDKGAYRRLNGYPCNKSGALSDFQGFTCIESIELSGVGATEDEKTEILNMLSAGVIV